MVYKRRVNIYFVSERKGDFQFLHVASGNYIV